MSESVTADAPSKVDVDATKPEVVIETRNLSKVYRDFWGRQKVRALKALDLEVRRGEILAHVPGAQNDEDLLAHPLGPRIETHDVDLPMVLALAAPARGRCPRAPAKGRGPFGNPSPA